MNRRELLMAGAGAALSAAFPGAAALAQTGRPKTALVLGGGSARGFAHIGVIKALEAGGFVPDMIVGVSAGSLVGAFYAAGFTGAQMEEVALKVRDVEIIDMAVGMKRGMVMGDSLQNMVNTYLNKRTIEQLKIPFAALATNLHTGEPMIFRSGDTGFAVRASSSIPAVFVPAAQGDQEYVDGGLISPVPIRTARQLGAQFVVAVDITASPARNAPVGVFEVMLHSFDIMAQSLVRVESQEADVLIRPEVARIASTDFSARGELINIGFRAGQRSMIAIRDKMGASASKRAATPAPVIKK